jgi:hypothetical protein
LRVSFGGKKVWVVRYRVHRRLRRMTLGAYSVLGLADARQRAKAALLQVCSGSDPASAKRASRTAETFGDLAQEYIERERMDRGKPRVAHSEAGQGAFA